MIGGSGMGDCDWGVGSREAIDGSAFVVMATAIVIGELICPVVVDVGAGETSTIWAVLLRLASGDGSGFGGGLSPWSSSFRSSKVWMRPLMTARLWATSALSAVRSLKLR